MKIISGFHHGVRLSKLSGFNVDDMISRKAGTVRQYMSDFQKYSGFEFLLTS